MIEEMIGSILEAEDKAREIIRASVSTADGIVNDAKKQAVRMIDAAKDEQYKKELKAAEDGAAEGDRRRAIQLEETQKSVDNMPDALQKNKKKVSDCIMRELKAKYDK